MTLVVIDASAGVEIVCDTRRGRALARLLPVGAEGWVPEHFYSEVLGVLRWQLLGQKLSESQASVAVGRLGGWHLRHASVAPLVQAAWSYRHNLTVADALYVALAEQLGASLLTDDHRLTRAPTFPSHVPVLQLPASL
ncbi:MAG TPA: type II toxin-antitoxin system VapC family toxin [Solirubrobacteraceae bacterium]